MVAGIARRIVYPNGLPSGADPATTSHYTWIWEREFGHASPCSCDPEDPCDAVNDFRLVKPDGRETVFGFNGDVCGQDDSSEGSFGTVETSVVYDGVGQMEAAKLRTTDITWDTEEDGVTGEVARPLSKGITTTYHDDTGNCFGASGSGEPRTMTTEYRHRDEFERWTLSFTEGDYLRRRRLSYTAYETEGDRVDDHILGAYSYQFVEEEDPVGSVGNARFGIVTMRSDV